MKKRRKYIVDWRLQIKYSLLIIMPIIILAFFALTAGFKMAHKMIGDQRQQLITQITVLENSMKQIEQHMPDRATAKKVSNSFRRLKAFLQELVAVNIYEFRRLTRIMFSVGVIVVLGSLFFGLIISHRIAGPIHRLEKIILSIAKGDRTAPIRTRATDEFKNLTNALELLRQKVTNSASNRKKITHELLGEAKRVKEKLENGSAKKRDLEALITMIAELEKNAFNL